MRYFFTSDHHLSHGGAIDVFHRDFESLDDMEQCFIEALVRIDRDGGQIVHLGDLAICPVAWMARKGLRFRHPYRHILVAGNHDYVAAPNLAGLQRLFGHIVGTAGSWKSNQLDLPRSSGAAGVTILLSHTPQRELPEKTINFHGHTHGYHLRNPESDRWGWLMESYRHFDVGVDVIGAEPLDLPSVLERWEALRPG